jgi:hypothetical protein
MKKALAGKRRGTGQGRRKEKIVFMDPLSTDYGFSE